MDLSIITSLYRSENHLPTYCERLRQVITQMNLAIEVVIVANDATQAERDLLQPLAQSADLNIQILSTPRETLYASWNRGIEASSGRVIGFWNVDDSRSVEGLNAAVSVLSTGVDFVDMAYEIVERQRRKRISAPYQAQSASPKTGVSPFFMFRRELYDAGGAFNPHFWIAGDYEWSKRELIQNARYRALDVLGGQFFLHAQNLSGGRNRLEWVEFNIVLLWMRAYEHLRPVDPVLMRDSWYAWGKNNLQGELPDKVAAWLWGEGAAERYLQYTRERNAHPFLRRIRLGLARRGLIKSTEFDAHQVWKGQSLEARNS